MLSFFKEIKVKYDFFTIDKERKYEITDKHMLLLFVVICYGLY